MTDKPDVIRTPVGIKRNVFLDIVSAAYTAYISRGRQGVPTVGDIKSFTGHPEKDIVAVCDTTEFTEAMRARGIEFSTSPSGISVEQQTVVALLTDPSDRRSLTRKLNSAGVPYAKYQAWMRDPRFKGYINTVAEQMLGDNIATVHGSLVQAAHAGKVDAIKFFYELTGHYNPAQQELVNVKALLAQVIESVQRRVTDKDILEAIATDFAMIAASHGFGSKNGHADEPLKVIETGPAGES